MIEPLQKNGDSSAIVYSIEADIDTIADNLASILYGMELDEYSSIYIDRAATKMYIYGTYMSAYTGHSYLSDEHVSKIKHINFDIDHNRIRDNLNNYAGYNSSVSVYMNFGKYAVYIDAGDINYLASQDIPVTYFYLDQQLKQGGGKHMLYREIRLGGVDRRVGTVSEALKTGSPELEAGAVLGLESWYTRFYLSVYRSIYLPFMQKLIGHANGTVSSEVVQTDNFISPDTFLKLATGYYVLEVRVRVPLDNTNIFESNIDYIDYFNGMCLLDAWWEKMRDFYCDTAKMGQEYTDKLRMFNKDIDKCSLLDSGVTFTVSKYNTENPNEIRDVEDADTSALNIYWWVREWQRQAREVTREYDIMFSAKKGESSGGVIREFYCSQMLSEAKYRAFKKFYKEGDYILTTLLPYENILDVDASKQHGIYSGQRISQYDLMANSAVMNSPEKMLGYRASFSLITSRALVTGKIVKIYEEANDSGTKKYLCDLAINYYSEGKEYKNTVIPIDIDKWYALPFRESEMNNGTDYRIDLSIIYPTYVFQQQINEYCERNSTGTNILSPLKSSLRPDGAFLMSLVQSQLDAGGRKRTSVTSRLGVAKRRMAEADGVNLAYLPNAGLYGAFMNLCHHAFKSPFTIKTTEETHFSRYLLNHSDVINQGLRFRFNVEK